MSTIDDGLQKHLDTVHTTVCHCWALTRRDGTELGFTDHDGTLEFKGITFRANTGLSALALQQTTGLSVDNTEAVGALSDAVITEADIEAGRYDGAAIRAWLVNWQDVKDRQIVFRGTLGELRRAGGAFEAELRGLTDRLNQPLGRVYQKPCSAVLGDAVCRFNLKTPGYFAEKVVKTVEERRIFRFPNFGEFEEGWFQFGTLKVKSGAAKDLAGIIKRDRFIDGERVIELWHPFRASLAPGDDLLIEAGCDKRAATCRLKFFNFVNFQGFPDIPGDDWTFTDPRRATRLDGGSRRT